ncbi:MAG TPA: AMP-binding protein [Clostridiaceae bacterium]|nr:AMP-binding protein [Clostridiaceae bacterium]
MKNIPLYDVRPIQNLKDMLESSVSIYKDKAAFLVKQKGEDSYKPISFNQYKSDVYSLGTALINLGLKDKRIALIGENRYEWAVSYLSVVNGTGVIVPLDKELPENEIENLLKRAQASAIIFSGGKAEQIAEISKRINIIEFYINMDLDEDKDGILSFRKLLDKGSELVKNGDRSFIDAKIDENVMTSLLFTSGTTENSKAVMLSHKNICSNLMDMCQMLYIDDKDTFLSVLPLHHTYECTCGFLCQIYRGSTIAYCEGLRHIVKNLKESKTTIMLGVPLIFEAIYRQIWNQASKNPKTLRKLKLGIKISNLLKKLNIDITKKLFAPIHDNFGGHLRLFISGAAGIDPMVAKGFRDVGIKLVQGYGLTECSPILAVNRDVDFKDDAAGLPLPHVEIRIDSPNDEGVGEIIAKGPNVMLGYYENPEANEKSFKDGWFYTGDLGFIDSDGFLHITGRKKDVIVTKNGKNIYPEEIEKLLNRSPYIKESLVFGKNDEVYGDVVVSAVIVPDMDYINEEFGGRTLSQEELNSLISKEVKAVNKSLVTYKYIKDFTLRETEFAKTTTKKIKRYMENVN